MKKFAALYNLLGKWKPYYLFSGFLLILSVFIRMLEPKILQVAIDQVIAYFQSGIQIDKAEIDRLALFVYELLPELTPLNLSYILLLLGLIFLVVSFFRGLFMFAASAITASCTEKAVKLLRDNLFRHLQLLPLSFHDNYSKGELIQRCTGDVETVRQFMLNQVVDLIRFTAIFVFATYMMLMVHVTFALLSIALVPLISITAYVFFKRESKVWTEHEAEQDKLSTIVQENLSGIRVVQAFAAQDFEKKKFNLQNLRKREVGVKHVKLHAFFWPFSDFLVNLQVVIVVLAGGYFTLLQQISVGELVSFYTYATMVTWPMRQLGRIVSQIGMSTVAMDRISAIMGTPEEDYNRNGLKPEILKGDIEYQDVWFRYRKDETDYILNGISFKIKAGEKVALLGLTGSGKSSVIALLNRFYDADKGQIFIDGKPIEKYDKAWLRSKIGIVLQNPFLFSTTIEKNISYAKPDALRSEIVSSAKAANIHDMMHVFNSGYETIVGEKGVTLSGGQKQRIALARTLVSNPDILVLDDTTSAVDTETESRIQKALKEKMKSKTTFIISHRISSVMHADKIIILDKGKIIEQGKHEELIKKEGFYKKALELQEAVEEQILKGE